MEELTVLKAAPGCRPEAVTVPNTLQAMQEMVGGLIQVIGLDHGICLVCNDEGKLMGLEGNRRLGDDIIAGPFFLVGENGRGEFCSLSEKQLQWGQERFAEPETFQPGEIERTMRLEFYTLE